MAGVFDTSATNMLYLFTLAVALASMGLKPIRACFIMLSNDQV